MLPLASHIAPQVHGAVFARQRVAPATHVVELAWKGRHDKDSTLRIRACDHGFRNRGVQ
jgi:hypothetical protein